METTQFKTCNDSAELSATALMAAVLGQTNPDDVAAAQAALLKALTGAGAIAPTPGTTPSTETLTEAISVYINNTCSATQIANQSVYIPYIVIQGPNCDKVFIDAYVALDQESQCTFARAQDLLRRANLAGKASTGGGGAPPPSTNDLTLGFTPTQFWIGVALIALLVLIGAFFAGWFSRRSNTASD